MVVTSPPTPGQGANRQSRESGDPGFSTHPLVPIAFAFATGIIADETLLVSLRMWLATLAGCLLAYSWLRRHRLLTTLSLLVGVGAVGGAWNQIHLEVDGDDIENFATGDRRLVRLEGIIVGDVVTEYPDPADEPFVATSEPRTHCTLAVERMEGASGWWNVSGRASVLVSGVVDHLESGDRVRVLGWLTRPRSPANPGEFDYRSYLAAQGVRASLFTESPSAVEKLPGAALASLFSVRDRVRNHLARQLHAYLPSESARIGEAFLLGARSALPPEQLLPFVESGTVHILVVSGLHVGLLAGMVWVTLTALGIHLPRRALLTILAIAAYTFLTGGHPPAVRAAVLTGMLFGGYLLDRDSDPINSLAGSVLVVLAIHPADLFRPGPQLSFLCAFALLAVAPTILLHNTLARDDDGLPRPARAIGRWLVNLVIVSVVLWVITAPLVMFHFHLWSPIGIVASLPLVMGSGVTLALAVFFFATSWISFIGSVIAMPLNALLESMAWTSRLAARAEPFCQYVAGPAGWWVLGFYATLITTWFLPWPRRFGRAHLALIFVWLGVGIVRELIPTSPDRLAYTQLAVGHGLCGVLRGSDGETVILDCGSIRGPRIADRVIAPFLWSQRVHRIDAVVISHPDIDHFNGILRLARRFPMGEVVVAPQFTACEEPAVAIILEELRKRKIPIRFVWKGDVLQVGEARINVLHPPAEYQGQTDNAESLVLRIEHGGCAILLTGDLADDGLVRILEEPMEPIDVLVAPHHGSRSSNDDRTARWAQPAIVVSSQGEPRGAGDALEVYSGATIFRTDQSGAVQVEWTSDGLRIRPYASRPLP